MGILSGAVWDEQFNREYAAAKARERDYAERHKSLQRMLASIDECFSRSPDLNERLLKRATAKMSPASERTFLKFKMFCEELGLPLLPEATPQGITLFVLEYAADVREAKRNKSLGRSLR